MSIDEYSYLWIEKKDDYVLVKTEFGYAIIDKKEKGMLLISDDELNQMAINKMLEKGNRVYNTIVEAYEDA